MMRNKRIEKDINIKNLFIMISLGNWELKGHSWGIKCWQWMRDQGSKCCLHSSLYSHSASSTITTVCQSLSWANTIISLILEDWNKTCHKTEKQTFISQEILLDDSIGLIIIIHLHLIVFFYFFHIFPFL